MLEREVLRQVRELLQWRGWKVYRIQQSMGSHKGFSDLVAAKQGRVVFIECKGSNGKLSYYQQKFRDELLEEKVPYWLISDIEQLNDLLNY